MPSDESKGSQLDAIGSLAQRQLDNTGQQFAPFQRPPTALGPVANTDTKLLIYGLFLKGRVLAQDGIENVWSLFKRSIMDAFHKVSAKHLDRYLEELEWRFNNRNNQHIFRDTLRRIVTADPLTYKRLVA